MKISVLMPAYNASRTMEATINSVLRQTVSPWEFLIVDDGSTDNTAAIAERFAPQVKVIRPPAILYAPTQQANCLPFSTPTIFGIRSILRFIARWPQSFRPRSLASPII
jgi:glycosyltransferase involved in cell wall biosynthesis